MLSSSHTPSNNIKAALPAVRYLFIFSLRCCASAREFVSHRRLQQRLSQKKTTIACAEAIAQVRRRRSEIRDTHLFFLFAATLLQDNLFLIAASCNAPPPVLHSLVRRRNHSGFNSPAEDS